MPSYTPDTPEQYRFRWAVRSLTINDRFVALYDSHATPRSSIAPLHDVLGIRSEKMSVFFNDVVSQQADLLNGQRISLEEFENTA